MELPHQACRLEDDKLIIEPDETFTVQFAPGLGFETRDLAIYGGLNPSPADVTIPRPERLGARRLGCQTGHYRQPGRAPVKRDLLASCDASRGRRRGERR